MRFSRAFRISKTQAELDFVNVRLETDVPLFIDPYAISKRADVWSIECHNMLVGFFQQVIDLMRERHDSEALRLLRGLGETNDTRLGLSSGRPQGRGVSGRQAGHLFRSLRGSEAVRTGLITELSDCELMVDGIARDKISDITTKIIKKKLIEYTRDQCLLHGVPLRCDVPSGLLWDRENGEWTTEFCELPCRAGSRIVLVPKAIVRYNLCYDHVFYYNQFILDYLRDEHLSANSSLVRTLKSGAKRVYKKDLRERFPCRKDFIYRFSRQHPEVLHAYKSSRSDQFDEISNIELDPQILETELAIGLINRLRDIRAGREEAAAYHELMVGALEFIFYPFLMYPRKEQPIHTGRKKIDIWFTNSARAGFFQLLRAQRIPSLFVIFECKNYRGDPKNPELDQVSGRFSRTRGKVGFLMCRTFRNKALFVQRCRDTASDGRGIIVPLDDQDVVRMLLMRKDANETGLDEFLNAKFCDVLGG